MPRFEILITNYFPRIYFSSTIFKHDLNVTIKMISSQNINKHQIYSLKLNYIYDALVIIKLSLTGTKLSSLKVLEEFKFRFNVRLIWCRAILLYQLRDSTYMISYTHAATKFAIYYLVLTIAGARSFFFDMCLILSQ